MAIGPDEIIAAADYIQQADADATPANDEGRVPLLEVDGQLSPHFTKIGFKPNAGATINGGTLPVPVYQNKTDNELYACDGNDLAALKFLGFAVSNSTNGNPIKVQLAGIVGGFTGLDEGEKYYLSDTAGAIQNSPGTYEVLVGVAISPTQLLIQKGRRCASGTFTISSTGATTVTVGFRASRVSIHAHSVETASSKASVGGWSVFGGNRCVQFSYQGGDPGDSGKSLQNLAYAVHDGDQSNDDASGVVSVNDTQITFTTNARSTSNNVLVFWEAEGDF